jgi:hypothetical protein
MTDDSARQERAAPPPDHGLPKVVGVEVRRGVRAVPRRRNFVSALPATQEAVEFIVETDRPFPARALGPALYVGDTPIVEVTEEDPTHYRFVAFEPRTLSADATLSLGWSGRPEQREETDHRFAG